MRFQQLLLKGFGGSGSDVTTVDGWVRRTRFQQLLRECFEEPIMCKFVNERYGQRSSNVYYGRGLGSRLRYV